MRTIDLGALEERDADYNRMLQDLCNRLQLDYAAYATFNGVTGDILGYATYPEAWRQHYLSNNLHLIDPTIRASARSVAPVEWSRFEKDKDFHTVFSQARAYGITPQGVTVPVRGPYGERGLLNVTRNCPEAIWREQLRQITGQLQLEAVRMHDKVQKSAGLRRSLGGPDLSERELEILQWIAAGKSQQDVGDILAISHRTVEVHLRSSREKLGALTTAQAIGRAIGYRLIHPG